MLINNYNKSELEDLAPFTQNFQAYSGETLVYVCRNYKCNLPTKSSNKLEELLKG